MFFHRASRRMRKLVEENARLKEENARLGHEYHRLLTESRALSELVYVDELTTVFNRRWLRQIWKQIMSMGVDLGVIFVDVDGLKMINDLYGHRTGDRAIAHVAGVIQSFCGGNVCRYGGDEFLALTVDVDPEAIAQKIISAVRQPMSLSFGKLSLTVSIGVFRTLPGDGSSLTSMIECADQAMYQAKRGGRDQIVIM